MRNLLLTLIVFFLLHHLYGQINKFGIPFIRNYDPKEYNGAAQNWSAIQDKRGVMYFGNTDVGVLEYDGNTWRSIKIQNNSIVRSMVIDDNGVIYIGAVDEIGYLTPDHTGNLYYHSLLDLLDTNDRKLGDVYKTYYYNHSVYFFSLKKMVKFTPPDNIGVINLTKNNFWSFIVGNHIYTSDYDEGLKEIINDSVTSVKNGKYFAKTDIWAILPYDSASLLLFVKPGESNIAGGIYFYNVNNGEVNDYKKNSNCQLLNQNLTSNYFYDAIKVQNKGYIFSTIENGSYITDLNLNIISQINNQTGLRDKTTIFSYNNSGENFYQPIWFTLNNGIAKSEINSSLSKYGEESGLSGIVMDIVRFKGVMYVATTTNVFYLDDTEKQLPFFKPVKNVNGAWAFLILKLTDGNEKLLVGSQAIIGEIKGNTAYPVDNESYICYTITASRKKQTGIIAGLHNSYKVLYFKNNKWFGFDKMKEVNDQIRSIYEDSFGNVWLSSYVNGIIRVDSNLKIFRYNQSNGIPFEELKNIKVFEFKKEPRFITAYGLYKFNYKTDSFVPDTSLGKSYADGSKGIFCFAEDKNGVIWLNLYDYKKNVFWTECLIPDNKNGYRIDSLPFKRLPEKLSINNFFFDPDNQGIVWFATPEGVYCYNSNIKRNYSQNYNTLIRKVVIGEDSVIFNGTYYQLIDSSRKIVSLTQPDELKPVLPYHSNRISFHFAAPFFEEESLIKFSYYLEGFDEGWSKWSLENKAPYTNLPEGKYKFHVKAKNIYDIEGVEAVYEFEILPPWYRTLWAYISYAIIVILIVWGIVKLATYRMKQLNIAYGRYLPGAFLNLLEKRRVIDFKLGDMTEKEMTIMFSDIRSYTSLSETMTPSDNFRFQVRYLSMIGIELNKNHGFPVQYYGDGIVAMFPGDPDNALAASIDMHKRVENYSKDRKSKKRREIRIGVGMHTGKIIMGIRGDQWRWEGGIVGDSVNLASRIEGLTKFFGTSTLISDDTYDKIKNKDKFNIRFLGRVKVKGKDTPVGLYELMDGLPAEEFQHRMASHNDFNNALMLYYSKDFIKALEIFNEIINKDSNDFPAHHYIDLCKLFIKEGVPDDWDGVEKLDKK